MILANSVPVTHGGSYYSLYNAMWGGHSGFWSRPSTKAKDGMGQNLIISFYFSFSDHSEHSLERLSPKGYILLSFLRTGGAGSLENSKIYDFGDLSLRSQWCSLL